MRRLLALATAVTLLGAAAACSGDPGPAAQPTSTPTGTSGRTSAASPSETATPPPTATAAPAPDNGTCYRLSYDDAIAPTAEPATAPCPGLHTAETYVVDRVDNVVDGHLLAVDSDRVQEQVARSCPARLSAAVGGSEDDLRLSMLRAVWFTPTVEESDAGADWYRCDVIALKGPEQLARVRGSLEGVLGTPAGRDTFGMCGTAGPDDPDFTRVLCREPHSWRAFAVIDVPGTTYPGPRAITEAGETPCQDAAADLASDPLDYEWGFEGPDKAQWQSGQTFIRCWSPEA